MRRGHRPSQPSSNRPRFWGRHAVAAALANPERTVRRVWGTREALAAFDAIGIVTQDRHAPPESGALARSASGALETVPWVRVVNLARALDEIGEAGFWRIGLTGHAPRMLADAIGTGRVALVLGAEGEGMRQNTETHCDELAKLPISPKVESLNVSNAAAIALYAVATRG